MISEISLRPASFRSRALLALERQNLAATDRTNYLMGTASCCIAVFRKPPGNGELQNRIFRKRRIQRLVRCNALIEHTLLLFVDCHFLQCSVFSSEVMIQSS